MISARVQTDRIETLWDRQIMPDVRQFQIKVARETLADEQRRGFDPRPRTIIDRRRYDAPVDSVKPFGVIEYIARINIGEAVEWIWSELIRRSPVDSGRYQDSHVLMVNGNRVETIQGVKAGDRIQFVNVQPYSRKIERGLSLQAPSGVYRLVAGAARRRFRGLFVDQKWVRLNDGAVIVSATGRKRAAVYPAIQIYEGGK